MVEIAADDPVLKPLWIGHVIANALNRDLNRELIHFPGGKTLTVGEVRDETSQFMQALRLTGVNRDSRLAILSLNRVEVLSVSNAAYLLGACVVPLHPMGSADDFLYAINDSQIDFLIFDPASFEGIAKKLLEAKAPLRSYLSFGPSEVGGDLFDLAGTFRAAPLKAEDLDPDHFSRLAYSGGTTGLPKAIVATQRNVLYAVQIMMSEWEWPYRPRMLICSPLSHAGAAVFLPVLLRGGSFVVLPGFDPGAVLKAIQEFRINCTLVVPTMIYALLDHPEFSATDLTSLETVFYGSSSISPHRLKEAIEKIGPVFFQFYGQSEAPMTVCVLKKDEHDVSNLDRLSSCGRPVPWIDVELLDENNMPVGLGKPGEICVRGPLVMGGYLNKPDQTNDAIEGGWLHSGDIAVRDIDGFLRIVDRKKDMIVTGGFNVFPREIEDVLSQHPAVAESAVVGVPDEKWGEAVKAFIVLRPGCSVSPEELKQIVKSKKGSIHAPKAIDFLSSIPRTAVGKPDKKALRLLA
jgi:fatty-acyl-CoA synthase